MMVRKTISVWLLVEDGPNKGKVALQKRSIKDSSPHVCQATWAGGIEPTETTENAIKRECTEELGEEFCRNLDFSKISIFKNEKFIAEGKKWETHNYLSKINSTLLNKVQLHKEAFPEFVFIGENDVFYSINSGKDPKNNIVLFDDQYKILKEILKNKI